MIKSIMHDGSCCYLCGRETCLEWHHVMSGTANRKLSNELTVRLCHECHVGKHGAQYDPVLNRRLRREAQMAFEEKYSHDEWMQTFRKNYL